MILGLDISTSIIGATIVSSVGNVVKTYAWDMRNKNHFPDIYTKYNHVQGGLLDIFSNYNTMVSKIQTQMPPMNLQLLILTFYF